MCTKWKVFMEGGARKLPAEEKDFPGEAAFPWGANHGVLSDRWPHFPLGGGDGPFGRLTGACWKIPDWPVEITFLGQVETALRLCIKLPLGTWPE